MEQKFIPTQKTRLDVFLTENIEMSRSQLAKQIKAGAVSVNGTVALDPSFKLKGGESVVYSPVEEEKPAVEKPDEMVALDYVYKDEDIAIINKPRGMVVHPAPGHSKDTLVNYLMNQDEDFDFGKEEKDNIRPGIVHRIDKDTSGLLAVAMNPQSESVLQDEIKEGDFHREYLALVYGDIPDKKFRIDAPLTRPNHTERRALIDPIKGREAITHCERLSDNGKVSLLKCTLETGRTHQIRAHLASIGYPIVGDKLYGRRKETIANEGQCLHAFCLSLIHPRTLKRMTFYAPIDDYFKKLLIDFYH